MFSFHFISRFQHIFCLSLAVRLIYNQNNVLWTVCVEELKIVRFYMIMSIRNMVTLIFYVLVE